MRVNGAVFLENIYFAEQFKAVRLYAVDITELQRAAAARGRAKPIITLCLITCSTAMPIARCILSKAGRRILLTLKLMTPSESLTGLKNVAGKKVSEVIPGLQRV